MSLKVFNFVCVNGHTFEAMVESAEEFERQKKEGFFSCPVCGTPEVDRLLSAPYVQRKQDTDPVSPLDQMEAQFKEAYLALKKIVDESEYVGDRFTSEARAIKEGSAKERVISGTATPEEVDELREEGVEVLPIPGMKHPSKVN